MNTKAKTMKLSLELSALLRAEVFNRLHNYLERKGIQHKFIDPNNGISRVVEMELPTNTTQNDILALGANITLITGPIAPMRPPIIKRFETSQQKVENVVYHNYTFEYENDEQPYLVIMSVEGWELFTLVSGWKLQREEKMQQT